MMLLIKHSTGEGRGSNLCCGLQEVKFTHLIVATGTDGHFPGKFNTTASMQTAIQAYTNLFQQVSAGHQGHTHILLALATEVAGSVPQVQQADSILVVGGGTTGVEMAAELKTAHPDKKVTDQIHMEVT